MPIGIVVFAHGSSVESANEAVRMTARHIASSGEFANVATSFLEGGKPDLPGAVAQVLAAGATEVIVVPYFLTVGLHLKRDLPALIDALRAAYPDLKVSVTPPLDGHPQLGQILLDRAREGAQQWV